ncbi:MAG: hypothetical protein WBF87_14875 [Mesorhizobium sp.]
MNQAATELKITRQIPTVAIDTNLLKFAAVKHRVYRMRTEQVKWGKVDLDIQVRERYTVNTIALLKSNTQKRDVIFLAMIAYAAIRGHIRLFIHREVEIESWSLPGVSSASGKFFGAPFECLPDPDGPYGRIVLGGRKRAKEYRLEFLSGISHPRYLTLLKLTGGFQGHDKPLNLNQASDAFHLWCAESAAIDYFVTMDYKLVGLFEKNKNKSNVSIVTPNTLLKSVVPKFGFWNAAKFICQGYFFAKRQVAFVGGEGWE